MIANPVLDKGKTVGVLFSVVDLNTFKENFIDPIRVGNTGYAYTIADDISDVTLAASGMSNSSAQVNQSAGEPAVLAEELKKMVGRFKV